MEALMENGIIADNTTWKGINTTRMWIFVIWTNEVNTTRNSIKASRLKKKRLLPHKKKLFWNIVNICKITNESCIVVPSRSGLFTSNKF